MLDKPRIKKHLSIMMRGIIFFIIAAASAAMFAQTQSQTAIDNLPNLPLSPLSQKDIAELSKTDSPEVWREFSKKAKDNAMSLAAKQAYPEAAAWLYLHYEAELFAGDGAELPFAVKLIMLSDLPAFFDFYESIKKEDNVKSACAVLAQIYKVYPEKFKKYLRSAYAVSLVYDVPPPGLWPMCNTPSDPVSITQPEEVFNIFIENPAEFVFPMDKLVIGELVWIFGVGGPLDELRALKRGSMTPFAVEKLTQSIKGDNSRIEKGKYKAWDITERPFTPQNIMKFGGSQFEKTYCAWRVANANGIPCLFFTELSPSGPTAWLAYMSRPGVWKTDVARATEAKPFFGRPLNPQTWKTAQQFDIDMLMRRHVTTESGMLSMAFMRISQMLYEKGDYYEAAVYADRAKKANPENWQAYVAFISARARFGAAETELDATWRKSYEAFRRYPDMCIQMLNFYRQNLIALRKGKEADRLLMAEMRGVMRTDPGLGIDIYSEQMKDIYSRAADKAEVFGPYQDVLRNSRNSQNECFRKIVSPLAKMFFNDGDFRSAAKVVSMFDATVKDDASLKSKIESLKEDITPKKEAKRKSEAE